MLLNLALLKGQKTAKMLKSRPKTYNPKHIHSPTQKNTQIKQAHRKKKEASCMQNIPWQAFYKHVGFLRQKRLYQHQERYNTPSPIFEQNPPSTKWLIHRKFNSRPTNPRLSNRGVLFFPIHTICRINKR